MKELSLLEVVSLKDLAVRVRRKCVEIAARPTGCHLGGSLSVVDILVVLFAKFYNPSRGDEIILSKGHAVAALYSTLYECGLISKDPAADYGEKGSAFTGHPNNLIDHVRFATGALGHGPALGLGWALGQKLSGKEGVAYVVMGDGELQEGSCWEAFQIAVSKGVNNLVFIIDKNGAQNDGWVDDISSLGNLESKARAFGLECITIDGHDHAQLEKAIQFRKNDASLFVIAKTTKGKGVSALEANTRSHYVKANIQTAQKWLREIQS